MGHITLGSRVYYKDNGTSDTGTIVDILLDEYPFVVKWDKQTPPNPAGQDESIDQFKGNQLGIIGE